MQCVRCSYQCTASANITTPESTHMATEAELAGAPTRLQILCLHGSRQDGEVFSQRLKVLRKKLAHLAVRLAAAHHQSAC